MRRFDESFIFVRTHNDCFETRWELFLLLFFVCVFKMKILYWLFWRPPFTAPILFFSLDIFSLSLSLTVSSAIYFLIWFYCRVLKALRNANIEYGTKWFRIFHTDKTKTSIFWMCLCIFAIWVWCVYMSVWYVYVFFVSHLLWHWEKDRNRRWQGIYFVVVVDFVCCFQTRILLFIALSHSHMLCLFIWFSFFLLLLSNAKYWLLRTYHVYFDEFFLRLNKNY